MQDETGINDERIIDRILRGDVNAYESLVVKYMDHVFQIVRKHVPQDRLEEMAHETFVRAYQSLPGFNRKGHFKQWLATITARTCYDFWRDIYHSREIPMSSLTEKHQEWLEAVISDQSNGSYRERGSQKEAKELLDWALSKLSPEDRMVLELVYLEDLSVKEAAELLGWSPANVKVRSFRARRKIKKRLAEIIET